MAEAMTTKVPLICICAIAAAVATEPTLAAVVFTTDQIPNSTRTHFNGFESASEFNISGQTRATFSEGGIRVTQVNENIGRYSPSIATVYMAPGFDGVRSWYPSGGDYGYTSITMDDGSDFGDVGLLRGSGYVTQVPPIIFSYFYFELWRDGTKVQAGTLGPYDYRQSYVGFSGGGFDEIRLRDSLYWNVDHFGNGDPWDLGGQGSGGATYNALAIDNIEVGIAIPEPSTLVLAIVGVAGYALTGRRRDYPLARCRTPGTTSLTHS